MGAGIQVKGPVLTTQESQEDEDGGAILEPIANAPPLPLVLPPLLTSGLSTQVQVEPPLDLLCLPPQHKSFKAQVPSSR